MYYLYYMYYMYYTYNNTYYIYTIYIYSIYILLYTVYTRIFVPVTWVMVIQPVMRNLKKWYKSLNIPINSWIDDNLLRRSKQ